MKKMFICGVLLVLSGLSCAETNLMIESDLKLLGENVDALLISKSSRRHGAEKIKNIKMLLLDVERRMQTNFYGCSRVNELGSLIYKFNNISDELVKFGPRNQRALACKKNIMPSACVTAQRSYKNDAALGSASTGRRVGAKICVIDRLHGGYFESLTLTPDLSVLLNLVLFENLKSLGSRSISEIQAEQESYKGIELVFSKGVMSVEYGSHNKTDELENFLMELKSIFKAELQKPQGEVNVKIALIHLVSRIVLKGSNQVYSKEMRKQDFDNNVELIDRSKRIMTLK